MGSVNIAGRMAKKSIVRDLQGQIINLLDESDGGWIIRNRQVVNPEKYAEMLKKEEDRKTAALAIANQKVDDNAPDRTQAPGKVEALEKRIDDMDNKLDAILNALKK